MRIIIVFISCTGCVLIYGVEEAYNIGLPRFDTNIQFDIQFFRNGLKKVGKGNFPSLKRNIGEERKVYTNKKREKNSMLP